MRLSSTLLLVVVLITAVSLVCIWFYPSFQDFMETNTAWNGIRTFDNESNVAVISSLDMVPGSPDKSVLIVIPGIDYSDQELAILKQFINDGGTMLLMDDFGYGNTVLKYLGVNARFSGKPLLDPLFCYQNQSMPRITDFVEQVKERDISVITLNHATTLNNVITDQVIAWSSTSSFLDINDNGAWEQGESQGPLVVAAKLTMGEGNLKLVSDSSIIINNMLSRDNNKEFIQYLTQEKGEINNILVDSSHLVKAPLDTAKERIMSLQVALSNPYALLGIIAVIFATVFWYNFRKGETVS
ncbi:MAG: DUF4350 domain-containing protein [Dehalococcoidales bacterium]|nr:DUF4350 domain-containing protein [Dehalococcoidales bacterium]